MASVDGVVTLLSFRTLGASESPSPSALLPNASWLGCEQALTDPTFFPWWRATVAHQLAKRYGPVPGRAVVSDKAVPDKTTGGYVLQWYLAIPSYLGAVLFHAARRVPSLAPRQLSFRLDLAELRDVALRPGRFWCLPGDPDAGHPDAVAVPDEASLGAVLRREVVAHATRFLSAYGPQLPFGRHAQWAAVTDRLDKALLLAGKAFGSPQAGAADARLVLADGAKPLTSASKICEVTDDLGRTHWTRRRGSCCFLSELPGVEHPCASCPRISETERARILATLHPA
ncbi:MAG: (2Fe-2S)-binding protein [Pseudonocardiaceae bacterium]